MKTIITYELDEGDDIRPYADPLAGYSAVLAITGYLRELDRYGTNMGSGESVVDMIRGHVLELCEDIPSEWKQ